MNETPPNDDQGDDLEDLYRRSSAHFPSRPSARARQAILEHSARLAKHPSHTQFSGANWRRPVLFGSLAAAAVACLLIGPQFLHHSAPSPHVPAPAMQTAPSAAAPAPDNSQQVTSTATSAARMAVSNMQARRMPNAPGAAAVDARDADGRTALMLAVLQGRLDAVVDLLRRGADPNAADTAGVTPLEAARAQQRPEIVDALLHAGAR
jgi:hypothetical protein